MTKLYKLTDSEGYTHSRTKTDPKTVKLGRNAEKRAGGAGVIRLWSFARNRWVKGVSTAYRVMINNRRKRQRQEVIA